MKKPPVCLSIAGLDPSGGAGTIADIKTFSAFGCFATAAVASITFQNTVSVYGAQHQSAETVRRQVLPILEDYEVGAVKTGMLPTAEIIRETACIVRENHLPNLVVDPVVRSTSGFDLIDGEALQSLIDELFPLALIITPNVPEAERITGIAIRDEDDLEEAAGIMRSMGPANVLIKGGHLPFAGNGGQVARDLLFTSEGRHIFEAEFLNTRSTHGTGCTLSAAITARLAFGDDLPTAVSKAKQFVTEAILTSPGLGRGHSPLNIQPFR
jgi:hydroxymethylpyrimidine kinase/phosphomethylpyrimidine kinase